MKELQLDPPWRQAVENANKRFDYGDSIPRQWLMDAFLIVPAQRLQDVDKKRFEWLRAITEFRELLSEKYHKELRPIPGYGYQIVKPKEQTDFAKAEMQKDMRRTFHKWERRLTNINERMLSLEEARHNVSQRNKLATIKSFNRKQLSSK